MNPSTAKRRRFVLFAIGFVVALLASIPLLWIVNEYFFQRVALRRALKPGQLDPGLKNGLERELQKVADHVSDAATGTEPESRTPK